MNILTAAAALESWRGKITSYNATVIPPSSCAVNVGGQENLPKNRAQGGSAHDALIYAEQLI